MYYNNDKNWASRYLLDPLTEPEPNQLTGPPASIYKLAQPVAPSSESAQKSSSRSHLPLSAWFHRQGRTGQSSPAESATSSLPSPWSASAFASAKASTQTAPTAPSCTFAAAAARSTETRPRLVLSADIVNSAGSLIEGPPPPYSVYPPRTNQASRPALKYHSHRHTMAKETNPFLSPSEQRSHSRSASVSRDSSSSAAHHGRPRNHSLNERFPGDMSHRPLDMIRREVRAADRPRHRCDSPRHQTHRKTVSASGGPGAGVSSTGHARSSSHGHARAPHTDLIDNLDTIGGSYHHGGPYDAALASTNLHAKYAPIDAVRESNEEALRATPAEFVQDSLRKHVPLQGVATIPSGTIDPSGRLVRYEEGADLMREPDAPGGAYKRWEGMQYHPEDLKGKGEPSYTWERDHHARKREGKGPVSPTEFEMMPRTHRRRSTSINENGTAAASGTDGVQRRNTTGRKFGQGLKKRFGRKNSPEGTH